jgi:hypothetical protein
MLLTWMGTWQSGGTSAPAFKGMAYGALHLRCSSFKLLKLLRVLLHERFT